MVGAVTVRRQGVATVEPCKVSVDQAREFLTARFGGTTEPEPLGGGYWSSAYGFCHDGRELVVRFGSHRDWFEADRAAMAFDAPDLPVPEVIEIGDALGGAYAVSARHHGIRLEQVPTEQAAVAGPMIASLLVALYRVPTTPDLPVRWHSQPPSTDLTWRDWLVQGLVEDPGWDEYRWRAILAQDERLDRIFRAADRRIRELLEACRERRDLVHGDLLNANVLVAEDASRPTAIFSWKCSVHGDFLYDTAWCTFWAPSYPGIAAADPWRHVRQASAIRGDAQAWADAAARHHCYELHIGATHLAWCTWLGEQESASEVADELDRVLERGPLPD